uniref:Uncharacterized protein C1orf159 homolog isoform X3 n=1 Tax=Phascolarctos cinereus TaxID=38626 RepID=A0A6P5JME7_PHACI|nr:uncharacterized protein C1orf159 homolog isoform X3 [Phascolarctos cinereus]
MSSVSALDQVPQPECCMEVMDVNVSCPGTDQCASGCYRHWNEDGTSSCIRCRNESLPITGPYVMECRNLGNKEINFTSYRTTVAPLLQNLASVLQPGETAAMIPPPNSSVRKPRYVRRDRSLPRPTTPTMISSVETRVSNV